MLVWTSVQISKRNIFMKNTILKSILGASLLLSVTSCSDFGDMNVSPNSPANPNTASLFTGAMRGVGGVVTNIVPALYVQQFGDVTYIEESRYKTIQFDYSGTYTGPLNNLDYIIKLNTDEATKNTAAANGSNANQIATARILKARDARRLIDRQVVPCVLEFSQESVFEAGQGQSRAHALEGPEARFDHPGESQHAGRTAGQGCEEHPRCGQGQEVG